ncbi:MAG TPA: M28 family metallopeptidase [Steroidobacteraceae bacterium]|nr:M28 family metallopeptidase [Steroidobacteraceae bacterium]
MTKRKRAGAFALALAGSWAFAGDGSGDITADRIHGHMAFLADDALEGRAAATRGHEIAAAYVASQFAANGLKPAGDQGGWYQTVPLLESYAVVAEARASLERNGVTTTLASAVDFLPRANFNASEVTVTGPLVFVGYGVSAPDLGYDDFAGIDLKGRVAVVLNGAPPAFPVDRRAYYSSVHVKGTEMAARGAVGVITIGAPVEEQEPTWERRVAASWLPGMRWVDEDGNAVDSFAPVQGNLLSSPAGTAKLFEGAPHTLEEVFALATLSKPQGFALQGTITFTIKSVLNHRTSVNVVGLLPGKDAKLAAEYLVMSAHLDHLGHNPALAGDAIYNGALDNASGVAILLENSRVLAGRASRMQRSMLFVALTAEEKGLLGSEYFLHAPPVPRASIVADINIDMPVALTNFEDLVAIGSGHSSLGRVAVEAARDESLYLSADPWPEQVRFVRSDQFSFVRSGIPAILIDVGVKSTFSGVDAFRIVSEFRRNHYHQPGDDLSQPIDYEFLAKLARVNAHMAYRIANEHARPSWNDGDFFGRMFGAPR